MTAILTKNGHKFQVNGFYRHVGPTTGHWPECFLVQLAERAQLRETTWPPFEDVHCTCDDWSPA